MFRLGGGSRRTDSDTRDGDKQQRFTGVHQIGTTIDHKGHPVLFPHNGHLPGSYNPFDLQTEVELREKGDIFGCQGPLREHTA